MAKLVTKTTTTKSKKDSPKSTSNSPELQKIIDGLNKKFGVNAVTLGFPKSSDGSVKKIQRIPTGSFSLDIALGGGIPVGRYTEISGAYSSTKTSQTLMIISEAQKLGYKCVFLDVEGTTTLDYAKKLGVDTSDLIYSKSDGMEEATQLIIDLQRSGLVQVGVIDTIAAMSPTKEQETDMDESMRMGIPQQLLGQFFRKYQAANNRLEREQKTPFTLIGINQLREAIGKYGDPEYTPGGRAKGFAASIDIRFRKGDWIAEGTGDNKEFVGQVVKFKIDKNKTHKRMQTGEFDFYFANNEAGVVPGHNDICKEVIMCGVEWGVIERAGAWFMYNDKKYQGLSSLIDALKNDESLIKKIKKDVLLASTRCD